MKQVFSVGDKSRAICPDCEQIVSTTLERQDVSLDDGSGTVPGILAGVCDQCGTVVSIPAQSAPVIRQVMDRVQG
ncbi:hypothetical protein FGK63_20445 [Ruegeria sediminis]|uniref:Uncharacterized protein n=1 Tax=Ruegeria sediminis TaxID=2583820 RepID=A0ABY2WST3_9RHOB|nr:hypothetical protein [Ruegeria sediminis]TMV02600.1 hypothetical protein FGK63_20445 [Ruegeria sediminis]